MNRKNTLVKNVFIFGIGTSFSKLMTFLLAGVYTRYILKADYGYYDVLYSVIMLIAPLVSLSIIDALYRHLLDANGEEEERKVITSAFAVLVTGLVCMTGILVLVNTLFDIRFGWILPGYIASYVFFNFAQQTVRGLQRNVIYALSGMVYTVVMIAVAFYLIAVRGNGVEALLYSVIIANVVGIILIECTTGAYRRLRFSSFSAPFLREMCRYSIPLLPNQLIWWGLPLVMRISITNTLGYDYNGIFAVAAKFPNLLMTVVGIFVLAWQESAITEYKSEDRDGYYSATFNHYMRLLLSTLLVLLAATRAAVYLIIDPEYHNSLQTIPFLYIGCIFYSLATFISAGYLGAKKTSGVFLTTMIGALCGSVCLFLLPSIGLYAAALTQMTAYLVIFITRAVHSRKYIRIRVNFPVMFALAGLSVLYTFVYYRQSWTLDIVTGVAAIGLFFYVNRVMLSRLLEIGLGLFRKKKAE